MAPDGYSSLAAEVFTSHGESTWQQDDGDLIERAVNEFDDIGFLPKQALSDGWVLRVPYAYPVYYIGYADKVRSVRRFLNDTFANLHLVGRTGSFRYMNSDGVIEDALALNDYLTGRELAYIDVSLDYKVD